MGCKFNNFIIRVSSVIVNGIICSPSRKCSKGSVLAAFLSQNHLPEQSVMQRCVCWLLKGIIIEDNSFQSGKVLLVTFCYSKTLQPFVRSDSLVTVNIAESRNLFTAPPKLGTSLQKQAKSLGFLAINHVVFVQVKLLQVPLCYPFFNR